MFSLALVGTLIGLCIAQPPLPSMPPSKCNRDAMIGCLDVFYEDMDHAASNGDATTMNPAVAICRNYADIDMCLREVVKDCAPMPNQILTAFRKGLDYFCHTKSQETQKLATCMIGMTETQASATEKCFVKLWKERAYVMQDGTDYPLIFSKMCGYIKKWETCLEREARDNCDAGEVVTGFFNIINKNLPSMTCEDVPKPRTGVPSMPDVQQRTQSPSWRPPFDPTGFVPSMFELSCNQPRKMEQCMEPIIQSHRMGPPTTVDEMCRMARETEKCVDSISDTCGEEAELIWKTLHKVVSYACEEKREEFKDSVRCLNDMAMDLPRTVMKCVNPENDDGIIIDRRKRSFSGMDTNRYMMCGLLSRYEECLGESVQSRCGGEARDFVEGLFRLVDTYTEKKFALHCQAEVPTPYFMEPHHRWHKVKLYLLAAGVPALVIIIVLVIVIVVVCRRKSSRQTKADKVILVKHDLLHENMKQAMAQTSLEKQKV